VPMDVEKAISLEAGAPALYALVSDTTSEGHAWLPSVMPDGTYTSIPVGADDGVDNTSFSGNSQAPTPFPVTTAAPTAALNIEPLTSLSETSAAPTAALNVEPPTSLSETSTAPTAAPISSYPRFLGLFLLDA